MSLSIHPLSPTLGVELRGLDPRRPDDAGIAAFRRAFDEKHFVLVRGHELSEDESVGLAERIGRISDAGANMKGGKRFTLISNVHPEGRLPDGELLFHADHMFLPHPLKAISLYAMAVPAQGGETRFLDMAAAYEALPESTRRRLEGLQALHVYDYSANTANKPPSRDAIAPTATTAVHPVVLTHPATGKKILFVCRLFTVSIVGMPRAESDELLGQLFDHIERRPDDYEHKWQVGDFIVWDNRILQHARNDFPSTEKRAMRRVPIADERAA
ncbi:TauD/TfdA family dioxygenase [Pigmentiphaga soli]|uniref:TauD/TfdA family dioxygenase n=1 Tax=Pigmentiphaga soli TaxID=1007095 RepID=A0ABP8HF80_9BURK